MKHWCLVLTIGLTFSFYQPNIVYAHVANSSADNATSKLISDLQITPNVQSLIKAYNEGRFQNYDSKYNWIKYYYYMGRNYYVNHTGFGSIENSTDRRLCIFSASSTEGRLIDELGPSEDFWQFDTIKFYCPKNMLCCNLTCCKNGLPWWATIIIVAFCMLLLALLIYAVGRGFKTYEKRHSRLRSDTALSVEEKHMLEPR